MDSKQLEDLATKRIIVGYLGEREQFGFWQSSFFTQGSSSFLAPTFGRTQLLAQYNGVSRSAAITHDARIGVGNVYHLFRLPEDLEQSLYNIIKESLFEKKIRDITTTQNSALEYLRVSAKNTSNKGVGPTRIGKIKNLRDPKSWDTVSGLYLSAFEKNSEILPFFSDTE